MKPEALDAMLPPMRCDPGCGECCGVAPCSAAEFDRIREWAARNGVVPVRQGVTCPWYQGGACAVYPVRPTVCRLFGHSPRMKCCRGYNVNVAPGVERAALRGTKGERLTHEAAYTIEEVREVTRRALVETSVPITVRGNVAESRPSNKAYSAALHFARQGRRVVPGQVLIDENTGVIT